MLNGQLNLVFRTVRYTTPVSSATASNDRGLCSGTTQIGGNIEVQEFIAQGWTIGDITGRGRIDCDSFEGPCPAQGYIF